MANLTDRVGFTFRDGSKYVGEFVDYQPEGEGTLTRVDGTKGVGRFVE